MRITIFKRSVIVAALLLFPSLVQAHVQAGDPQGLHHGFIHPFTGLDHLLATLGVGLWAARRGGRAIWSLPAAFVCMMTLGSVIGMLGASLPGAEALIASSVLAFGLLVAFSPRMSEGPSLLLAGGFAVFHGFAHGHEMGASVGGLAYGAGLVLATLALLGIGAAGGLWLQRGHRLATLRWIGAGMAVASVWFFAN